MKRRSTTTGLLIAVTGVFATGYWLIQRTAHPETTGHALLPRVTSQGGAGTGQAAPNDEAPAEDQQAVVIHLRLSDGKFGSPDEVAHLQELELTLEEAITRAGSGEVDGNQIGDGEYVVFAYGPDADKLFASVEKPLRASRFARSGFVLKRYGFADDENALEVRVDLDARSQGPSATSEPSAVNAGAPSPTTDALQDRRMRERLGTGDWNIGGKP